jgi:PAS domain S-box-containing protein
MDAASLRSAYFTGTGRVHQRRARLMEEGQRPWLSGREQQVLELAAEGLTDRAIARRLGISEATVGTYWVRVRAKLGAGTRAQLVAAALRAEADRALLELRAEKQRLLARLTTDPQHHELEAEDFRSLVENAGDAMLVVTEAGRIAYCNAAAAELFGWRMEELVGMPISKHVPARFHDAHQRHVEEYFAHSERRQMGDHRATYALRQNGTEFLIAASLSASSTVRGLMVLCIVREVSEAGAVKELIRKHSASDRAVSSPSE